MSAETLERLAWWLAWAYPLNAGFMVCYTVIMFMAFLHWRQPHMMSAMMAMVAGALMFSGLAITAFNRPFDPILLVSRVPAALLSAALLVHTLVSGVEEWHRRKERKHGPTDAA